MGLIVSALGYALIAGAVRLNLPLVESRWQVLAFWLVALAAEFAVSSHPSLGRVALNGCAATAAIIVAKWYIEGAP
jgi:hypothetical protein